MPQTLHESPRYTKFISGRDAALERIHQHAQIDISRILFDAFQKIERMTSTLALKTEGPFIQSHLLFQQFEDGVLKIFTEAFPLLLKRIRSMRTSTYILTYASEQEAIGRATQAKDPRIGTDSFRHGLQKAVNAPTILGPLDQRVWHALMQLRQRLGTAFLASIFSPDSSPQKVMKRVKDALPPIQVYKRPPKALSKVRESMGRDKRDWFDFDFIDEDDWDLAVQAYKDTELPPSRFDDAATYDPDTGMMRYDWELEQEITEDFVRQARDGQLQAARDLGIQEFVWVAILDAKTCDDCCAPRNGKTTREIEEMGDDDCDATVPPAHINCRCQIAPVASVNEVEGPDWESFNEWLET